MQFTMPQLGESVTEGTVGKWLKREGESVKKYEALLEVTTDKVNAEVPAPVSGVVRQILVPEGATVAVGQPLVEIEEVGAKVAAAIGAAGELAALPAAVGAAAGQVAPPMSRAGIEAPPDELAEEGEAGERRATPLVRRLAREHGVDLARIAGTGPRGRITKEDVLAVVARPNGGAATAGAPSVPAAPRPAPATPPSAAATAPPPAPAEAPSLPPATGADEERVPLSPVRRQIAEHMMRSKQTVPHATTLIEVDMTGAVRLRERLKGEFQRREGIDLTYLPFVVKAAVEALKEFPYLNASWGGDAIILKRRINVGIAVGMEDGLIVPVIHDADRLSIAGLARAARDLADRARGGKLTLDDVQGGTFTVNNTGTFGSIQSTPIIPLPQAAIMTMEAIVKRPVVIDDAIAIRSMMNLCLAIDHRVVDGLTAGRFLQSVKRRLERIGSETSIY
ncbi:MAG: 2-oxo acid dehydrogenase subunit E2 [Chloroflexi bacterium]|nr:2-oxo acid dehydrogenase subunit E2 [Chloroflexota bacterium]